MTVFHAKSVQEEFSYNSLITYIANKFEKNNCVNLPWDNIKRTFRVNWSELYYDVMMEINSRVFSINQGVLLMITFRYENRPRGDRYLIPVRQDIPLW
jgi:hypothetical protein